MIGGILALFLGGFAGSGGVPVITKLGLQFAAPLVFVFFRFFFASLFFLPFFILFKKKHLTKKDYLHLLIVAILLFGNVTFFTVGVQYTTVIMSQLLYLPTPIVVIVLSHFFLQERLTKNKIFGLGIALTGVLFLISQSITEQKGITFGTPVGNIIILLAMLSYSGWVLYSRYLLKSHEYTLIQMTFFTFVYIALYLLCLLPIQQLLVPSHVTGIDHKGILFAVGVAAVSIVQYFFVQMGIKKTNAFTVSLFQYVGPIFAGVISIPLLHEKVSSTFIIGGIFVMIGVFYATTLSYVRRLLKKDVE